MPDLFPFAEYWWLYGAFAAGIALLLALDLGVLHRRAQVVGFREAALWTAGWVALALVFNALDLKELYIVPKINLVPYRSAAELLLTQSATQFASPYLSAGIAQGPQFASEAGIKFRLRVDWPWRILGAGYEFAGVRLGVRWAGFDRLEDGRFIVEFGAGLW